MSDTPFVGHVKFSLQGVGAEALPVQSSPASVLQWSERVLQLDAEVKRLRQQRDQAVAAAEVKDAVLQMLHEKVERFRRCPIVDDEFPRIRDELDALLAAMKAQAALSHSGSGLIEALREYYEAAEDTMFGCGSSEHIAHQRYLRHERARESVKRALAAADETA